MNISKGIMRSQVIAPANEISNYLSVEIIQDEKKIHDDLGKVPITTYENIIGLKKKLEAFDYVYVREIHSFLRAYILRKIFNLGIKIIYDFRALVHEESYYRNGSHLRRAAIKKMEILGLKKADYVTTVSYNLKKELKKLHQRHDEIIVIPCGIQSVYQKKGSIVDQKSDIINFVYVGSLSKWQCFNEMIDLYTDLSNYLNIHLTVVTRDVGKAEKILAEKSICGTVKSLPQEKVAEELQKHDFGFLLRENHIMNRVASPVKFLEYTSNGVIPIISEGVGDYSDIVKDLDIGIIWKENIENIVREVKKKKSDKNLHNRLFRFSNKYKWSNLIKSHPIID